MVPITVAKRWAEAGEGSHDMAVINYITSIQFDFGAVGTLARNARGSASAGPW